MSASILETIACLPTMIPLRFGAQDLVIISLKAHAIAAMLPRMRTLIAEKTVVVPAINGLPWWYFHGAGGALEGTTLRSLDPGGSMFAESGAASHRWVRRSHRGRSAGAGGSASH